MLLPRLVPVVAAVVLSVGGLVGCSSEGSGEAGGPSVSPSDATTQEASPDPEPAPGGAIALLMPGAPTMRQEAFDRRSFTDRVSELCETCAVDYYNADRDPGLQAEQLATATNSGAGVIVLDAVDPFTVATTVSAAQEIGITVIGYDTLLEGLDYYVGFDHAIGGELQARALLRATRGRGSLVMLNGSPVDPGAVQVKQAARQVFDASRASVVGEYDAVDGKDHATRAWLDDMFVFYPPDQVPPVLQGVNAGSDDLAGQAIAALVEAGADPADLPPVTGYGAQLAGIRRIIAGRQLMTVYEPVSAATDLTAEVAVAALQGQDPGQPSDLDGVPAFLIPPVPVTAEDVEDTVVADGYWPVAVLCRPPYARDCARAGLR